MGCDNRAGKLIRAFKFSNYSSPFENMYEINRIIIQVNSVLQMQIVRRGSTPPVTKCCSKELPDTNFLPKTMPRLLPEARPRRTVQKENTR